MKFRFKREDKPFYIALAIAGLCIILVLGYVIAMTAVYSAGHSIRDDRTADINVMITRPENWKKIETGKISLTPEDFAMIDGSTATIPITAELARQFCDASDENIWEYVDHNTTHNAYKNLIFTYGNSDHIEYDVSGDGSVHRYYDSSGYNSFFREKHLLFVTEPSADELESAKKEGVSFEITPVALDGFVFITHKDNPVDSLTVEQVQQIYSGRIKNWKEVGGNDSKIIPYQRAWNSGSQTAMKQLVMKDIPLMDPSEGYSKEVGLMGELIERVAEYENRESSLGYTYYYYINNLYRSDDIKVLNINGVSPDNENLISGAYPFSTAYYMVMAEGAAGSQTAKMHGLQDYLFTDKMRELRDYLLTDEGQEIIKMAGYCPVGNMGE